MLDRHRDLPEKVAIPIVVLLTAIALILRLYHLDLQCVGLIEEYTRTFAAGPLVSILSIPLTPHENPPAYYLLAWASEKILGATVYGMRFPAAIFGAIYVPALYLLGTKYHSRILGILSAILVVPSYSMIYYSQTAKPYTLVMFAFAAVTYCFIGLMRGENKYAMPFCILSGLCIWAHYFSITPLAVMWCILIYRRSMNSMWLCAPLTFCLQFAYYYYNAIFNVVLFDRVKSAYWFTWDIMARMLPFEFFGYAALPVLAFYAYGIYTDYKDALVKSFMLIVMVSIASVLASTFFFESSPRYILSVLPLIALVALKPVAIFCMQFSIDRILLLFMAIFYIIAVLNYHPLDVWYSVSLCESYFSDYGKFFA